MTTQSPQTLMKQPTLNTSYHENRLRFSKELFERGDMMPFRYVFVLTNKCNLRCSFCFQDKGNHPGSMTKDDWLKVIDQLPAYAHVTLTGGEPLLFKGFEEIFLAITKKHTCNVISNGVLLNTKTVELLLSQPNFKVLSISVDNVENTIRDVPSEKWAHTKETLAYFRRRRSELGAQTVLDTKTVVLDENTEDLYRIHRYCLEDLGADTHTFMFLKGSPIQHADSMVPPESMWQESKAHKYLRFDLVLDQLEQVRVYNRLNGRRGFTHPKTIDLNSDHSVHAADFGYLNAEDHEKSLFHGCRGPWESVHINNDGSLFPCMAIGMGNVKTSSLQKIIFGQPFEEFKAIIRREGTVAACNRCGYLCPKNKGNA
ncbi:MAG: radical SAM protein [Opitutaceae bacterium]|nr:radical SAM protein [Opitutaceae bacterium]